MATTTTVDQGPRHMLPGSRASGTKKRSQLKAGDWVQVRTKEEILATLDHNGELDNMPFMPEMLAFCGQRLQVYKRAHKTCDTVFPVRGRRLHQTVHLATRCDGQAHGGCQAGCLLFWKDAWLKPTSGGPPKDNGAAPLTFFPGGPPDSSSDELSLGLRTTCADDGTQTPAYVCQATRLPYATSSLTWWDIRQYIEDYRSKNVSLWRILNGFCYSTYRRLSQAGIGLGRPMRFIYDKCHWLWQGTTYPRKVGLIPVGQPTPAEPLNLQPGELVRVKSHLEILQTISTDSRNRGLWWDAEMVPYCGKTYRVLKRVTRIIDEATGLMREMKTPCIVLENVVCQARYSECRMFCPRSIPQYWREIWLERVEASPHSIAGEK